MSSRAIRCTPKRCALPTTYRRIDCDLRSNPPHTDAAHCAASIHRIRRPADHPVHWAETDRGHFLVMDMGLVAAVDRLRHRAADRSGCVACGGAVVSERKHSDDEVIAALESCGSINKAAKHLGVARYGLQARVKRLALKGYSPAHDMTHTVPDGFKVKGVSTYYD